MLSQKECVRNKKEYRRWASETYRQRGTHENWFGPRLRDPCENTNINHVSSSGPFQKPSERVYTNKLHRPTWSQFQPPLPFSSPTPWWITCFDSKKLGIFNLKCKHTPSSILMPKIDSNMVTGHVMDTMPCATWKSDCMIKYISFRHASYWYPLE